MRHTPLVLDKKQLKDLYDKQRLSTQQIADKLGCSDSHVLVYLHKYGIPVIKNPSTRVPGLTEKNLKHLYTDFRWSTIRIAKELGCNDESVRQALKRYGIPIRSRSDAGKLKEVSAKERERLRTHFSRLNLNKMGEEHPSWKGGRYIDSYGYVVVRKDGRSWKEHRWVMTQRLGRELAPCEEINHISGVKTDNRIENLQVIHSLHKHIDWIRIHGETTCKYNSPKA